MSQAMSPFLPSTQTQGRTETVRADTRRRPQVAQLPFRRDPRRLPQRAATEQMRIPLGSVGQRSAL